VHSRSITCSHIEKLTQPRVQDTLVSWWCLITGLHIVPRLRGLGHQTYSAIQKKLLLNIIYFKSADGHNVLAKKEIGSMDEFFKKTLATYSDTLKFRKQTCELKPRQQVLHPECNKTYTSQWNHHEMFQISVALWANQSGRHQTHDERQSRQKKIKIKCTTTICQSPSTYAYAMSCTYVCIFILHACPPCLIHRRGLSWWALLRVHCWYRADVHYNSCYPNWCFLEKFGSSTTRYFLKLTSTFI
jgi:hypothetical protein